MLPHKSQTGFTLLEVMVACSILTIGLAAVITVYSTSLNGLALAGKYEAAQFTAETVLARALFAGGRVPFERSGQTDQPAQARWSVRGTAGDLPGLRVLTVTVSFKHAGKIRNLTLETSQAVQTSRED